MLNWFDFGVEIESLYRKLDLDFNKLKHEHLEIAFQVFDGNFTESMRLLETMRLMDYFKSGLFEFNSVRLSWARVRTELEIGESIKATELDFLIYYRDQDYFTRPSIIVDVDLIFPELVYRVYSLIKKYHLVPLFDESPENYLNHKEGNQFIKSSDFTEEIPY